MLLFTNCVAVWCVNHPRLISTSFTSHTEMIEVSCFMQEGSNTVHCQANDLLEA